MSAVVAAARGWLGTPFCHGASLRRGGSDCLGLIRGVYREVVGREPGAVPSYGPHWAEVGDGRDLEDGLRRGLRCVPASVADAPGDILLFRARDGGPARHLGIRSAVGPHSRFIHAYAGHGVVETSLSAPWTRRIVARFHYPLEG